MLTAIEIHDECKQIMSCTSFASIICENITKEDISVIMELPEDLGKENSNEVTLGLVGTMYNALICFAFLLILVERL
jgi:hypothetical protein